VPVHAVWHNYEHLNPHIKRGSRFQISSVLSVKQIGVAFGTILGEQELMRSENLCIAAYIGISGLMDQRSV
jgi:hypothetical protein